MIDDMNSALKCANAEWSELERFIIAQSEATGSKTFGDAAVSVSISSDLRPAYDPEKWEDIVRWATATGNFGIVQRRLGDKVLKSILDSGGEIPPGVRFDPFTKVSVRRK